ncbi:uncharacterized protein LOC113147000 [Cyclospora cayetanensis]|uniref:Uncharacterized protein LOC113147000 n=1 Tax=Cyclospora cayetanensis TaxID=88456 RepID=A0A6P6RWE0_9EIME|nr:uncharacterized protein LOC113147000 [Cyclospora cayetanensis]
MALSAAASRPYFPCPVCSSTSGKRCCACCNVARGGSLESSDVLLSAAAAETTALLLQQQPHWRRAALLLPQDRLVEAPSFLEAFRAKWRQQRFPEEQQQNLQEASKQQTRTLDPPFLYVVADRPPGFCCSELSSAAALSPDVLLSAAASSACCSPPATAVCRPTVFIYPKAPLNTPLCAAAIAARLCGRVELPPPQLPRGSPPTTAASLILLLLDAPVQHGLGCLLRHLLELLPAAPEQLSPLESGGSSSPTPRSSSSINSLSGTCPGTPVAAASHAAAASARCTCTWGDTALFVALSPLLLLPANLREAAQDAAKELGKAAAVAPAKSCSGFRQCGGTFCAEQITSCLLFEQQQQQQLPCDQKEAFSKLAAQRYAELYQLPHMRFAQLCFLPPWVPRAADPPFEKASFPPPKWQIEECFQLVSTASSYLRVGGRVLFKVYRRAEGGTIGLSPVALQPQFLPQKSKTARKSQTVKLSDPPTLPDLLGSTAVTLVYVGTTGAAVCRCAETPSTGTSSGGGRGHCSRIAAISAVGGAADLLLAAAARTAGAAYYRTTCRRSSS